MVRLAIFPPNGLDRSLHAPILIGLVFVTFFSEAFGWTYAGLVVPGYLAGVMSIAPFTGVLVTVEALLTYVIVASVGLWIPKTSAWSTTFGRERFFLYIISAVMVRLAVEGYLVPFVLWRYGFAHSRELYSVGLVLIPLFANVFWTSGLTAAAPRLLFITALTYLIVEYVFVRHTNFSVSRLLIANESGAMYFLASPKAQIILLIGALLGARGNVLYGWDYNGILVPALLAVAWYEPTKLVATFAEALAVYGLSVGLMKVPPFSRLLIVGTRRMLVAVTVGFVVKMGLGFALARFAPRVQLVDYLGFGYVLPSLLAVKMWNKGHIGIVLMPTIQVSLTAFVGGNALAYALSYLAATLAPSSAVSAASLSSARTATALMLGDVAPDPHHGWSLASGMNPTGALLRVAKDLGERGGLVTQSSVQEADRNGMRVARDEGGGWIIVAPRSEDPEADAPAPRAALRVPTDRKRRWVVVVRSPAAGSSLHAVAYRVAEALDAAAIVVLSRHAEVARSDRQSMEELARAVHVEKAIVIEAAASGGPRLTAVGTLPAGLDINAMGRALGREIEVAWGDSNADGSPLLEAAPRLAIAEGASDEVGATLLGAPPVESWNGALAHELIARVNALTAVGVQGYALPSIEELRLLRAVVIPPFQGSLPASGPPPWIRAVAGQLGYHFARIGPDPARPEAWALVEPEGPGRRGASTWIEHAAQGRARLGVEVPAPRWEVGTLMGALSLFESLSAKSFLLSGAMPHADVLGRADARRTDARRSFYQLIHEAWLASGNNAISVQGIAEERAAEDDLVLSLGHEIPEVALEPPWTSPIRSAFEQLNYRVGAFDGARSHATFGGSGDPTMEYAERFAYNAFAIVWLGPRVRSRLVRAEHADSFAPLLARLGPIPTLDVAEESLRLARCQATAGAGPKCPAELREDRGCDLAQAVVEWERFSVEANPHDLAGLSARPGCYTRLLRDDRTNMVWAIVAKPGEAQVVPVGVPADRSSKPVGDVESIRRGLALRLSAIHVRPAR